MTSSFLRVLSARDNLSSNGPSVPLSDVVSLLFQVLLGRLLRLELNRTPDIRPLLLSTLRRRRNRTTFSSCPKPKLRLCYGMVVGSESPQGRSEGPRQAPPTLSEPTQSQTSKSSILYTPSFLTRLVTLTRDRDTEGHLTADPLRPDLLGIVRYFDYKVGRTRHSALRLRKGDFTVPRHPLWYGFSHPLMSSGWGSPRGLSSLCPGREPCTDRLPLLSPDRVKEFSSVLLYSPSPTGWRLRDFVTPNPSHHS